MFYHFFWVVVLFAERVFFWDARQESPVFFEWNIAKRSCFFWFQCKINNKSAFIYFPCLRSVVYIFAFGLPSWYVYKVLLYMSDSAKRISQVDDKISTPLDRFWILKKMNLIRWLQLFLALIFILFCQHRDSPVFWSIQIF